MIQPLKKYALVTAEVNDKEFQILITKEECPEGHPILVLDCPISVPILDMNGKTSEALGLRHFDSVEERDYVFKRLTDDDHKENAAEFVRDLISEISNKVKSELN